MPIQFRCNQCGKLLRTEDATAGRQAACPECGALTTVPGVTESTGTPPPLAPLTTEPPRSSTGTPDNPFGGDSSAQESSGAENPYQSPGVFRRFVPQGQADPLAAERIAAPANALLAVGILNVILHLVVIGLYTFVLIQFLEFKPLHVQNLKPPPGQDPTPMYLGCGMVIAASLFGLAMDVILLIGVRKMRKLDSYLFAVIASIIAMIPCISPCCLLGLPFGIWALLTLNDSSIRMAFRN